MNHKKIFIALMLPIFYFSTSLVFAGPPIVYFSDLTDGPVAGWNGSSTKGAAVSIWGVNFGTSRGSSFVSVGGVQLKSDSDYAEWGATTAPRTPRGLQRITFWLNSSMSIGPTAISVTTSNGTSKSIPFYTRNTGNIYFVARDGSDSNDGKTINTPWLTFKKAKGTVVSGDVVYFRKGIWTEYEYTGSSSAMLFFNGENSSGYEYNNGIEHNSITLVSYPGEVAQIGDGSTTNFLWHFAGDLKYWTFSKFKFNIYNMIVKSSYNTNADFIRWIGLEYTTTAAKMGSGYAFSGYMNMRDYRIYGCYAHDCGGGSGDSAYGSPMYFGGGQSQFLDIGWNEFTRSHRQIQFYGHKDTDYINELRFHDNFIHDNYRVSIMVGGGDPATGNEYAFIKNGYIYNNIFSNNYGEVRIADGSKGTHGNFEFYNNTLFNNALSSGTSREFTVIQTDYLNMHNNIIYAGLGSQGGYFSYLDGSDANIYGNHNCWFGQGNGPLWDSNSFDNVNPQFIVDNPVNYYDFRLKDSSPIKGLNIGVQFDSEPTDNPPANQPPTVSISADQTSGNAPLTVNFNGSGSDSDGVVVSYLWDFGDGSTSSTQNPTHTYGAVSKETTYNVFLTVTDDKGAQGKAETIITVSPASTSGETHTVILGDAQDSNVKGTCADTFNNAGSADQNYANEAVSINTYTWPDKTSANTIIMKWDMSSIPQNATVTEAKLYLYQVEAGGDVQYEISVHKILNHDVDISKSNWNTYDGVNNWTGGRTGGLQDIAPAEDVQVVSSSNNEYKVWTVTEMVQNWISNPVNNFGMLLTSDQTANKATINSYRYFAPTENVDPAKRPKLVISYTIGEDGVLPPPGTINAVAANSIDLSWSSVSGAVGYNVYRSTTSGSGYAKINGSTPVTGTSYVDQNTTPGTTYYYVVTSVNSAGQESVYSSEASATEPIGNGAPSIGSFTAAPNPADNPKRNISFIVQASDPDGDALSYTIDFGDGSAVASASTAEHAYSSDGTYNAKATVADGNGHTVEKTIQVTVNDSDPAKVTGVHAQ